METDTSDGGLLGDFGGMYDCTFSGVLGWDEIAGERWWVGRNEPYPPNFAPVK